MSTDLIGNQIPALGAPSRRIQVLELAVFLFLILPSLAMSFLAIRQGGIGFPLVATSVILRDIALVCLLFYFLWRNGESRQTIGWNFRRFRREALLGLVLFPIVFFGAAFLDLGLLKAGFSAPRVPLPSVLPFQGTAQTILAVCLVIVVAICEETIFRGYLILRFKATTASLAAAVILSSIVFSIGHGYEGSAGVVTVGTMGLAFALVYVWRRSLVAPAVMHFLQDLLAIVIVPLLSRHA